jgi:snoRNA binding domain, fibrillarin
MIYSYSFLFSSLLYEIILIIPTCVACILGSLINLAKHPASTVQILGAEKALFRAMKTKHDTPKYGLLYHASLVGQTNPKYKGKVSLLV